MSLQPDIRIHKRDLASFIIGGKRFVVNGRPGVPRNACVEEFDGALRCWASHQWLDDEAAAYVKAHATYLPENNAFAWKPGVRILEVRKG